MVTAEELSNSMSKGCPEVVEEYVESILERLIKRYATKSSYYIANFGKEFVSRNEYISVLPVEGFFKMLLNSTSNLKIHEVRLKGVIDILHNAGYRVELYHAVGELYMVVGFGDEYEGLKELKIDEISDRRESDSHVLYL